MKLRRLLRSSVRALLAHRLRAILAGTSVAIGVAAVLVMSALGQGARDAVLRDVATMGTDLLVVRPAQVEARASRPTIRGSVSSLTVDDCEAVATLEAVGRAAAAVDRQMRVEAGRRSMQTRVMGVSASFLDLRGLRLRAGRFVGPEEDRTAQRVAVLGARVADALFPGQQAVGETLRIRGVPFEIIGVLVARGALADGSDEDGNVFVPIRTALRRLLNTMWLGSIFVSAATSRDLDRAEGQVRQILRERHGLGEGLADDFTVQNQSRLLVMREELARSLSLLAFGLAGASLVVGGTGILAFMTLSVRERTGEIGLRTALGARRRDIFRQFVVEASALALSGWLAGVVASTLALAAIAGTTDWSVGLSGAGIVWSLSSTGLAGLGLGALPARRAARLSPIDALRAGS
jgi:putative ABC transport system permease protein